MTERPKRLLGAWRAQVARLAFVGAIVAGVRVERLRLRHAAVV
jgi:hypothetical protein